MAVESNPVLQSSLRTPRFAFLETDQNRISLSFQALLNAENRLRQRADLWRAPSSVYSEVEKQGMSLEPNNAAMTTSFASTFMNSFPDVVLCITQDRKIRVANSAASRILGYTFDDPELTIDTFFPVRLANCLMRAFTQDEAEVTRSALPGVAMTSAHAVIPVEIRTLGIHQDEQGTPCLAIAVRDLNKPGALYATEAMGQRPGIGELSALVAHDVSNPLSVVKLYLEWISSDMNFENEDDANPDQDMLRECLRNIQESAVRIETLISRLRDFSRAVEPEARIIDMKDAVEDALLIFSGRLAQSDVNVKLDVPDAACPICANPDQLRHAFLYLLSNACDALAESEQRNISIDISTTSDSLNPNEIVYQCCVTDSGAGMPADVRDRAFEAFLTTKKGAAGLGMSMMRNIMRRHGGDVRIESEEGQGTSVHITVPALLAECGKTSEVVDEP